MVTGDIIDSEYNQIRLDILKAENKEENEAIKESIREFDDKYKVAIMVERLWDFYELIINKKTK